jgi:hypothetical protein
MYARKEKNACKVLVRKPEGKRPIERPKHMWEYIKMHLTDIG